MLLVVTMLATAHAQTPRPTAPARPSAPPTASALPPAPPPPSSARPPTAAPPATAPASTPPPGPASSAPPSDPLGIGAPESPSPLETWLASQTDGLGRKCDVKGLEVDGSRRVIACGESGLWVVQVSPDGTLALASVEDLGGPVTGLFVRGGRIWAEIHRLEARPVLQRPGGTAGVVEGRPAPVLPKTPGTITNLDTKAPAAPTRVIPDGEVTESGLGEVVVNLGRADGLRHGERVELSVTTTESVGGELAKRRRVLSVGVVTTLADGFSRVRLGLNEQVPVGAAARVVQRGPSESRTAPPRAAGLWEAGFKARPFVALDGLGGGLFMQGWAGYRFQSHFYLSGELHPIAVGDGEDTPAVVPVAALVMAAYDRDVFSLGLGLGGQTVNATNFTAEAGSGILIAQRLRLGARDGLHLDLRNDVVLFHSRFEFSGLIGTAQIPVGSGTWLLFEGGGGDAGFGYGEIGVRALYRGNGGPGSLFFTVVLGGVTVFKEQHQTCGVDFVFECPQEVTYGGPMLGVGGEWRF